MGAKPAANRAATATAQKTKTCPECQGTLSTKNISVRAHGWIPVYNCRCGATTPTKALRGAKS